MRTTSSIANPFPPMRSTRLFDELFDAWVFAARDATDAFRAWVDTLPRDRATAHAVYRAALDREESAAHALMITCLESRSSVPAS